MPFKKHHKQEPQSQNKMIKLSKFNKYKYLPFLFLIVFFSLNTPVLALNFKDSFSETGPLKSFSKEAGFSPKPLSVEGYIGLVLTTFFSVLGVISVILIIYSGFIWMTARGNEAKVTKAKDNLYSLFIGLLFILGAYALTTFLLKIFN